MIDVSISQFKAKCLALLEEVRRTRKPIRITRHGKPVAEVVPPSTIVDRSLMVGSMKDSAIIIGDIISPAHDEEDWEALHD